MPVRYEFTVACPLSERAQAAFPELRLSDLDPLRTTLYGPVEDRAHLEGILARFGTLGLEVTDMHRLPD
jgi:hypothetical protein